MNTTPTKTNVVRMSRDARHQQLLDAASSVFVIKGYHNTGMDEIAEQAGVSKPLLYQHFPSKMDLYLAVLDQHIGVFISALRRALRSTTDNHKRVYEAVKAFFDFVNNDTQGFRIIFENDALGEASVQKRIDSATESCVAAVFDVVRQDSGLDLYRAHILAMGLVGASQFTARYWVQAQHPIPIEEVVETTVTLAWGGLSSIPLRK